MIRAKSRTNRGPKNPAFHNIGNPGNNSVPQIQSRQDVYKDPNLNSQKRNSKTTQFQ